MTQEQQLAVVELTDVSFSYGEKKVLTNISFSLAAACTCVVRGANGAGKSTLLRLILGDIHPQTGRVRVLGVDPSSKGVYKQLGGNIAIVEQHVSSEYKQMPITLEELVLTGLYAKTARFLPRSHVQLTQAHDVIERVGLTSKTHALLRELSAGQLQRAFVARAMVGNPALLLLDEPTSSLDQENVDALAAAISATTKASNTACLFVTHDLARLPVCYDRVVEIQNAQVQDIAFAHAQDACHCADLPSCCDIEEPTCV